MLCWRIKYDDDDDEISKMLICISRLHNTSNELTSRMSGETDTSSRPA